MADAAWEYEDNATDQEKLQIAQHFLLSSPPGQVNDVLRDVVKLVPAHVLTDSALRGALHSYNVKSMLPVAVPDAEYKILICEDAQVDATHYVDPIGRRVLGFDHIKQAIIPGDVSDLPASFSTPFDSERDAVQKALQSYLQFEYMHQGTAGVFVKGSSLVINLCTERINLRNFYSGRWKSRWEIAIDSNPVRITGKMELHVHYFENGNLQLHCEKEVSEDTTTFDRANGLGDAILRVIKDTEDALQSNLEDMYINMSQETFKEMRRVMPVTQTKMDWSIHAHRTAKDLSRK
ncbi:hypothetical protein Poli38472_008180 [Pythium oligandrum]|uniref:F-actin-capping protein subunit alpha n=1 Tax=Pythium oligandrum TaxID=41045 RepID=A0A8K1CMB6_PYTOL|nr:hypothetical protein Poli38472_008180 [Pythium oligandrum]|eukprot:TMW65538.1 hypothetical protein Poli38472_008180 [Pythium oligandrum]